MGLHTDITYSSDDSGYYAEVFGDDGQTVYTTEVNTRRSEVVTDAQNWIDALPA